MLNRFLSGVALILIGVGVGWAGLLERTVALRSTQTPEEISLENLLARGPNGNPNIILTDFTFCKYFVYEARQPRVWIPIVPGKIDDPPAQPAVVRALISSTNVGNQKELQLRCAKPNLPALVGCGLTEAPSDPRGLLAKRYPGTNFDRCLIIREGCEPASPTEWMLMIGGGVAAVGAGLLLLLRSVIRLIKGR